MSERRDLQRISDVLAAIDAIELFVRGKSLSQFESDLLLQSGVQYQFLIIGEAIGAIPNKRLNKYDYPWFLPRSFRNFIIHEYHAVRLERIYHAALDLENLKLICLKMKQDILNDTII